MPITVAKIENLFWSNTSYRKPNCLPKFKQQKIINQKPVIYSFLGGLTHLYGDDWNYAIYEGVYYFLKIESARDVKTGHYTYALIRDLWINILLKYSVTVTGRLATTNKDKWIEANLNRCFPALINPVSVTRVSLGESKQGIQDIRTVKTNKVFNMCLLDSRDIWNFKTKWKNNAKKYKNLIDWKILRKGDSPIFVFAELKGTWTHDKNSWKENLKIKINDFLDSLNDNKDKLVISKVQSTGAAGKLKDHYCITWKNGGIGVGEENVVLDTIDLSGLVDIVPYNPVTNSIPAPNKQINEDLFKDVRILNYKSSEEEKNTSNLQVQKIKRKLYYPIRNFGDINLSLPIQKESNLNFLNPQHISLNVDEFRNMYLFWLDNVNFSFNYSIDKAKDPLTYSTNNGYSWFEIDI